MSTSNSFDTLSRLARGFENMTTEDRAEMDRRSHEADQERRLQQIASLRHGWNAPRRHVKTAVVRAPEWADKLDELSARLGSGMLCGFIGTRGTGKTQMAIELMRACTQKEKPALYTTAVEFFMRIKEAYRPDAESTERSVLLEFIRPALLVIDEIGKRSDSQWENNLLFELINRRYNDLKDTVVIDNRTGDQFAETIGPSLASRMSETGGLVECNWPSFR